jgi:hypothetical protein
MRSAIVYIVIEEIEFLIYEINFYMSLYFCICNNSDYILLYFKIVCTVSRVLPEY